MQETIFKPKATIYDPVIFYTGYFCIVSMRFYHTDAVPFINERYFKMFYCNLVVVFKLSLSFGITVSPDLFAILGWFIGDELPQTPPASKAAKCSFTQVSTRDILIIHNTESRKFVHGVPVCSVCTSGYF